MLYLDYECEIRIKESYDIDSDLGSIKHPENGIKGKILLSQAINLPNAVPLDYMHLICLGIFKSLLLKWFDSDSKKEYYIGKNFVINFFISNKV